MIALRGKTIQLIRYKVYVDGITHYAFNEQEKDDLINKYPDAGVEPLDVSSEEFLEGVKCNNIATAKEWRELGYVPKTEIEILQDTVDTLVISSLGV